MFVKLIGGKVTRIDIGTGPIFFQIGLFHIKMLPFAGFCGFQWPSDRTVNKFEQFLVLIGGVVMNALFAVILYFVSIHFHIKLSNIGYLIQINLIMIVVNLFPFRFSIGDLKHFPSDGKQILDLLRE